MKNAVLFALPLFLVATAANAGDAKWTIDPGHSEIGFSVRHLGLSNVKGKFKEYDAKVKADEKTGKLASVSAWVKTASIDTGIEKRDGHLRSDDFFNAEKHPQLKLVTKSIKWKGSQFTAEVDLTIRDKTKRVRFEGEQIGTHKVNFGDGNQIRAGYTASAVINRQDFGLKFNAVAEGVSVVSDEVRIIFDIQTSRYLDKKKTASR